LVAGEAAARIAEVAREHGFDLIVMPTHAGVFRRMLLGSTTAKVLNDADCIVMTTQHAETISPRPLEHREWVCAIGLSADSARVLRIAAQLAENSPLSLSYTKRLLTDHARAELDVQIEAAVRENAAIRSTADFREGISSFLEKRKPVWTGK